MNVSIDPGLVGTGRFAVGQPGKPSLVRRLTSIGVGLAMSVTAARADELVVYGAGSLREAISEIAGNFSAATGVPVRTEFGPSGRMRERIEKGEHADLFTSADIGHARKLVADDRASVMAMFARNTLCVLAPSRLSVTTETVIHRLQDPAMKIGISPPKADPLGDYTQELFARLETTRPHNRASLKARSIIIDAMPGAPAPRTGDMNVDAIEDGRVQLAVVYCSGRARYAQRMPDGVLTVLPASLQVGPEYGLAVLKNGHPHTADLALAILSPDGQRTIARWGFVSVTLPRE